MSAGAAADWQRRLEQGPGQDLHWFGEDVPVARLAVTLAGMANASGGSLLLGIANEKALVSGVSNPDELLDRVFQAALLVEPPLVLPVPAVQLIQGRSVLCVIVPPGLPHVYSVDGRYWGRQGAQTNPIVARRLRQMLLERGAVQFEARIPPEAGLDDLDARQIQAYLEALHLPGDADPQQVLLRRGCLQRQDGKLYPTYAGLLLFGQAPQQWLPAASILAARFAGPAFSDEFIKQDLTGTLPEQLRQAEAFLRANLRSVVRMDGLAHQAVQEYPFEAVRELLVNAVAHRDYNLQGDTIHLHLFSEHLEIHSPGGLPGPVTLENLLEARFARNAVITQVLSDLGFVERLGYGLDRVVTAMRQQDLRPPRFEEIAGTFRVTLFNDLPALLAPAAPELPASLAALNPRQKLALGHLLRFKRIGSREFQELCPDVHAETLRRDLAELVSHGLLIKIGDKRATYYILKNPLELSRS